MKTIIEGLPQRMAAGVALLLVVVLTAAGCGGAPAEAPGSTAASVPAPGTTAVAPAPVSADWSTYHHDSARSGMAADQASLGSVKKQWTSTTLDGAVYAQPLVAGGRVYVATEGDSIYALDTATGAIVWRQNLGQPVPGSDLPCGNIDPSGITGTPVIDTSAGMLYAVTFLRSGPRHELFALSLADGAVRWHRAVDPPGLQPSVEQQRGALALAGGRIFVPYGGLDGDCGAYKGAVVSAAGDGSGDLTAYIVPTSRMAGIWNPAGAAVDSAGDLWVTTGNSAGQNTFDFGNAVIRLSGALQPVDYFAPSDWAQLNAGDTDLGSLGPVLLPGGRALAMGKDGIAYLLDTGDLGHVGKALTSLKTGAAAFGAAAVSGSRVFIPTTSGLLAVDTTGDRLSEAWKAEPGSGPPIVAGGAVWAIGYDGTLRAFTAADGKVAFSTGLGSPVSRFVSPAAADGRVFAPNGATVVAFSLR